VGDLNGLGWKSVKEKKDIHLSRVGQLHSGKSLKSQLILAIQGGDKRYLGGAYLRGNYQFLWEGNDYNGRLI